MKKKKKKKKKTNCKKSSKIQLENHRNRVKIDTPDTYDCSLIPATSIKSGRVKLSIILFGGVKFVINLFVLSLGEKIY